MKERPILFSGEMMQAILERRKRQTRRIIKPQPPPETVGYSWCISTDKKRDGRFIPRRSNGPRAHHHQYECGPPVRCPYGSPGDALWCRETWAADEVHDYSRPSKLGDHCLVQYRATRPSGVVANPLLFTRGRWRPSIHMPRWASRATLEVTAIRAERLQSITGRDAIAEGFDSDDARVSYVTLRSRFATAWDAMYGRGAWERNVWVWVVSFDLAEPAPAS